MTKDNLVPPKRTIKVDAYGFKSHMNFGDSGVRVEGGLINEPHHEMHGKHIFKIIRTPKVKGEWQRGVVTFQVEDGSDHPPEFHDLTLLMAHYKLTGIEVPTKENHDDKEK